MGISTRSRKAAEQGKATAGPVQSIQKKKEGARAGRAKSRVESTSKSNAKASNRTFPNLKLRDDEGNELSTEHIINESAFVIFLYPRANTSGCTTQACGFRDAYQEIVRNGYKVYGLSYDSPKSQSTWKTKHSLSYPLLCDSPSIGLIKQLGAHKPPKSVKRSHFIVAKGGKILVAKIQISPKDSIASATQYVRDHPLTKQQVEENEQQKMEHSEKKQSEEKPQQDKSQHEKPAADPTAAKADDDAKV